MAPSGARYDALIFDLDGTLIDSARDIAASVNEYLAGKGWPEQDPAFVEGFIGNGPRRLLSDLFAALGMPCGDAELDAALAAYLANYERAPARFTRFYRGVHEDLAALHGAGFRLGICTNKPHGLTLRILDILGIGHLFDAVVGADAAPACKPDPAHLLAVARRMGLTAGDYAYVGDTAVDRATAAAAGVAFFAVPWGGGPLVEVADGFRLRRLLDLMAFCPMQARERA